jgi:hypothetical protein
MQTVASRSDSAGNTDDPDWLMIDLKRWSRALKVLPIGVYATPGRKYVSWLRMRLDELP